MRRLAPRTFAEIYYVGCNPGFVASTDGVALIDTPQRPIDAVRFKERAAEHGPIRYVINTEHHEDHVWGNAFFTEAEVVAQAQVARDFAEDWRRHGGLDGRRTRTKELGTYFGDADSVWLIEQAGLVRHAPTTLFDAELELEVGDQAIRCLHTPGHTPGQTTVHLPGEGVVFTGDNVFSRCRTWLLDADPWLWLESLERIGGLDATVVVPGHGEPCDMGYLAEQADVIGAWIDLVEGFLDRGYTEEEALAQDVDVRGRIDPHPMAQGLWLEEDAVTAGNLRNVYRRARARRDR